MSSTIYKLVKTATPFFISSSIFFGILELYRKVNPPEEGAVYYSSPEYTQVSYISAILSVFIYIIVAKMTYGMGYERSSYINFTELFPILLLMSSAFLFSVFPGGLAGLILVYFTALAIMFLVLVVTVASFLDYIAGSKKLRLQPPLKSTPLVKPNIYRGN